MQEGSEECSYQEGNDDGSVSMFGVPMLNKLERDSAMHKRSILGSSAAASQPSQATRKLHPRGFGGSGSGGGRRKKRKAGHGGGGGNDENPGGCDDDGSGAALGGSSSAGAGGANLLLQRPSWRQHLLLQQSSPSDFLLLRGRDSSGAFGSSSDKVVDGAASMHWTQSHLFKENQLSECFLKQSAKDACQVC